MIKLILCLLLCSIGQSNKAARAVFKAPELAEQQEPKRTDFQIIAVAIKSQEGIRLKSYKDVKHWSIGWGTTAKEKDSINLTEADSRLSKALAKKIKFISSEFPSLDSWSALVLAMTRYNVSKFGFKLRTAIAKNDKTQIAEVLQLYIKADGKVLKGLKRRRRLEAKLLLSSPKERQLAADSLQLIVDVLVGRLR